MDEGLIQVLVLLILLLVGSMAGRIAERRHRKRLTRREAAPGPTLTNLKRLPVGMAVSQSDLCIGTAVIATDYFKTFVAGFKTLVGGRMGMLESLLDRGRREAIQRMREQAASQGADMVLNVRVETSMIGSGTKKKASSAEVIAYGTAVKLAE
jgi:uncharacterized protein YbjQ (UPF0145 family)